MKKIFTLCAATLIAASATAQTVTESKTFDNWYIGLNAGVATAIHPSSDFNGCNAGSWAKDVNPTLGLRLGRYFTPVFGFALEGDAYIKCMDGRTTGTFVNATNAFVLGTTNFSNWFGGYKGEPRSFELVGIYGLGWGHTFGNVSNDNASYNLNIANKSHGEDGTRDALLGKAGLDFTFNLGKAKAWQLYIEPAVVWNIVGNHTTYDAKLNANRATFQLKAGFNYKFKNSNGTHNFTIAQLRDQAEIDGLNAKINDLRNDLNGKDGEIAAKNKQISDLQKALDECNKKPSYVKPETATNLQPTVLFRQGKSVVDKAQYAPIELIAQYMKNNPDAKIEIKGYASPEGSKELNQKLSEQRADAVKNILVKKYKISADRLTTKGMGATDKLFEQVEFNRVATFNDNSK